MLKKIIKNKFRLENISKQAGFAEPHSSSTIGWIGVGEWLGWGWVVVGVGLWLGRVGSCKKFKSNKNFGPEQNLAISNMGGWGWVYSPDNNATPSA